MDIETLSIVLSQVSVRQEASVSIMKKMMDQAESNGDGEVCSTSYWQNNRFGNVS